MLRSGGLQVDVLDGTVRRCSDIWLGHLPHRLDHCRRGHGSQLVPDDHEHCTQRVPRYTVRTVCYYCIPLLLSNISTVDIRMSSLFKGDHDR